MECYQSCGILGHKPMRFAWGFDEEDPRCEVLKMVLAQRIQGLYAMGVTEYWVACDPGVGLWSAEIINVLRNNDSHLRLYCHTPHEEQASKWAPYLRERYFTMLEKCTHISVEQKKDAPSAQQSAYRSIIARADILMAVYSPESIQGDAVDHAMEYAASLQKPMLLIHPDTFEQSAIHLLV